MSLLERVGMADQARKLPGEHVRRPAAARRLARALANDPPLLVADEPTGNLDSPTADVVFELFESLVDAGRTIVMVTHDAELAARTRRIVHMADGRILDGSLDPAAAPAGARASANATPRPALPAASPGASAARMRSVRWRKVIRDLGTHKLRTRARRPVDRRRRVRRRHHRRRRRAPPGEPRPRATRLEARPAHRSSRTPSTPTSSTSCRRMHGRRRCRGPAERHGPPDDRPKALPRDPLTAIPDFGDQRLDLVTPEPGAVRGRPGRARSRSSGAR